MRIEISLCQHDIICSSSPFPFVCESPLLVGVIVENDSPLTCKFFFLRFSGVVAV